MYRLDPMYPIFRVSISSANVKLASAVVPVMSLAATVFAPAIAGSFDSLNVSANVASASVNVPVHQRMVEKVHRLSPLPAYLRANGLFVIAPRFEARTKRMQHHDPFGLCIRQTVCLRAQQKGNNERSGHGPRAKRSPW